jgi:subtilisin family serine protease
MVHLKKSIASLAVLSLLSACGGGDSIKRGNTAPTASDVSLDGAKLWLPLSGSFAAEDVNGDELSVSAIKEGDATITEQNGVYTLSTGTLKVTGLNFVYTPMSADAAEFTYTVSDGSASASASVSVSEAVADPLATEQWHLRNTGQTAYAMSDSLVATFSELLQLFFGFTKEDADEFAASQIDPSAVVAGEDMNVAGAYALGVTGQNTIAVVVDSGLEIRHEDLEANVLPGRSINFVDGAADPTDPTNPADDGDHGTSVAGLLAASGWNGKGGQGVAPGAKLIGMNFIEAQSALAEMISHGYPGSGIASNEAVAVFNRSYGISLPLVLGYSEADEEMQAYSATELRSGKGAVNMKSSGNSFEDAGNFGGSICEDNGANDLGLTCVNGNFEPSQATPYYFSVAAVNANGKHTSYSTAGANVLISAPAGEYGTFEPAMITTDQSTCAKGYSSVVYQELYDGFYFPGFHAGFFPFNNPGHPDNPDCHYTSTFNGTSSAAPNASGVAALILSANPALSYRDVRDILVKSSTKVDPTNAKVTLAVSDGNYDAHPGWVTNGAGYPFNNLYGFGRVNAGKAVQMAKAATPLGALKETTWMGKGVYAAGAVSLAQAVPDNSKTGTSVTFTVSEDIKMEGAQFKFRIANDDFAYGFDNGEGYVQTTAGIDLAIEVISPAGTRSVLLSSKQALIYPPVSATFEEEFPGHVLYDSVFLSNAFYGESSKGTWTVRVLDLNGGDYDSAGGILQVDKYVNNTTQSVVEGVALRVFGH